MALEHLEFSRVWTDPTPEHGFTTYEDREEVVRSDMQLLFDELKNAYNTLVDTISASDIAFTPTASILSENVQAAIEEVRAAIAASWAGTISDNTITGAKMVQGAIDTRELHDDAVNGDKIAGDAVGNEHIADNAIHREQILNGEVTNEKLAPGVLPNKADLSGGIVSRTQMRLRRVNDIIPYGSNTYTITPSDMEAYTVVTGPDAAGGCAVVLPKDDLIPVGSYLYLHCQSHITELRPGDGAAMLMPTQWEDSSYAVHNQNEVFLIVKADPVNWVVFPLRTKVYTEDITNAAVTYEKTSGVQKTVQVIKNVKVATTDWSPLSSIDPSITPANFVNAPLRTDDLGELDISRVIARAYVGGNGTWDYNYEMIQECEVRLSQITSERFVFLAKTQPSKNLWFELIVF